MNISPMLNNDMYKLIIDFLPIKHKMILLFVDKYSHNYVEIFRQTYLFIHIGKENYKYYISDENIIKNINIFLNFMDNVTDYKIMFKGFGECIPMRISDSRCSRKSPTFTFNNTFLGISDKLMDILHNFIDNEDKDTDVLDYINDYIIKDEGDISKVCEFMYKYLEPKFTAFGYLSLYIMLENGVYISHNASHSMYSDLFIMNYFLKDNTITTDNFDIISDYDESGIRKKGSLSYEHDYIYTGIGFGVENIICILANYIDEYGENDVTDSVKSKLSNIFNCGLENNDHRICCECDCGVYFESYKGEIYIKVEDYDYEMQRMKYKSHI